MVIFREDIPGSNLNSVYPNKYQKRPVSRCAGGRSFGLSSEKKEHFRRNFKMAVDTYMGRCYSYYDRRGTTDVTTTGEATTVVIKTGRR